MARKTTRKAAGAATRERAARGTKMSSRASGRAETGRKDSRSTGKSKAKRERSVQPAGRSYPEPPFPNSAGRWRSDDPARMPRPSHE